MGGGGPGAVVEGDGDVDDQEGDAGGEVEFPEGGDAGDDEQRRYEVDEKADAEGCVEGEEAVEDGQQDRQHPRGIEKDCHHSLLVYKKCNVAEL